MRDGSKVKAIVAQSCRVSRPPATCRVPNVNGQRWPWRWTWHHHTKGKGYAIPTPRSSSSTRCGALGAQPAYLSTRPTRRHAAGVRLSSMWRGRQQRLPPSLLVAPQHLGTTCTIVYPIRDATNTHHSHSLDTTIWYQDWRKSASGSASACCGASLQ